MNNTLPNRAIYLGIFLLPFITLFNQIVITRIFSYTLYYHYAYLVISLAMLGMTLGALAVYLYADKLPYRHTHENLAFFTVVTAITTIIGLILHITMGFKFYRSGIIVLVMNFLFFLPSFFCSGLIVSMILTRYPRQVGLLYGIDLCGAALACIAAVIFLDNLGAMNALTVTAAAVAFAGWRFAASTGNTELLKRCRNIFYVMTCVAALACLTPYFGLHIFQIKSAKINPSEETPEYYETWNSHSHVMVFGPYNLPAFGWSLSKKHAPYPNNDQYMLFIDANAGTFLTRYEGPQSIEFLKSDLINAPYHVRDIPSTAVIGVGGGRDVLSALAFNVKKVVGIELNQSILNILTKRYGDFTGHLDQRPEVTLVHDEARSWLARSGEKFGLIQISLIDTWAATAAGALALSENGLYTVEGWNTFLRSLNDNGMLAVSRWYLPGMHDADFFRMISMGAEVMSQAGISNPREHMLAIRQDTVVTFMLSKSPFTAQDLNRARQYAEEMGFEILLSPDYTANETIAQLAQSAHDNTFFDQFPVDYSPSWDNRPFFFNSNRLSDIITTGGVDLESMMRINMGAMGTMLGVFIVVTLLTAIFIFYPLARNSSTAGLQQVKTELAFFAAIGLGFMFVEISQMQRLMIFLGHPTYSLAVVLFSLLLASGLGSLSTRKLQSLSTARWRAIALFALLVVFGLVTDPLISTWRHEPNIARITVAILTLLPIGFFMGMAFPLAMRAVESSGKQEFIPWFWGINGATSVCASLLAVIMAMNFGISASYWIGVACYAAACLILLRMLGSR